MFCTKSQKYILNLFIETSSKINIKKIIFEPQIFIGESNLYLDLETKFQ